MPTKPKPRAVKQPKIVVGYLHGLDVAAAFTNSLLSMALYEATRGRVTQFIPQFSGANVSSGRNKMVDQFLATDGDWLLMIDADMMWSPNILDVMIPHLDAEKVPILGGLCFGIRDGELFPTLYAIGTVDGVDRMMRFNDFPDDSLFGPATDIPLVGTGAAFLVVHRRVFEAIAERGFNKAFPWFQETELNSEPLGEDLTFCLRAGLCGFPVHVHTGAVIGHQKQQILDADGYRKQQAAT